MRRIFDRLDKQIIATLLCGVGLLLATSTAVAQTSADEPQIFDEEGYLLDGAIAPGGVALDGMHVELDPDGRPRFLSSASAPPRLPEDVNWSQEFGVAGIVGQINVVATSGCDDIYVGGEFSEIGGVAANNIARFDGVEWHPLGAPESNGTSGVVYAITVDGDDVYVGGRYDSAGGVYSGNIARFDGSEWHTMGRGVDSWYEWNLPAPGRVDVILVDRGTVYIGGDFDSVDSDRQVGNTQTFARNVARWDGSSWSAMGNGLVGDQAGQPTDMGQVYALAVGIDGIYAGGRFIASGTEPMAGIARWNGATWQALPGGLTFTNPSTDTSSTNGKLTVFSIAAKGGDVYVGGRFDEAAGLTANNIARWSATRGSWAVFGEGSSTKVYSLTLDGRRLYASGTFRNADVGGAQRTNGLAVWLGNEWHGLGTGEAEGTDDAVVSIATSDGEIFVAGRFGTAGPATAAGLALWSVGRQAWVPLNRRFASGGGIDGPVYAVALTDDFLYVGGRFSTAGLVQTKSLARWNRRTGAWSAFGGGIDVSGDPDPENLPSVRTLAVDGINVYVGGRFDVAGGAPAYNIARWNGTEWAGLGDGIGANYLNDVYDGESTVYAIAARDSEVYVGGTFTIAGGDQANRIARYSEGSGVWSTVGTGITGSSVSTRVNTLALDGENLYVGGSFATAGSVRIKNIGRFDGTEWTPLGTGIAGEVHAIAVDTAGIVYAGGEFSSAGGRSARAIAAWNGSTWQEVGGGFEGSIVYGLAAGPSGLYAAGTFKFGSNRSLNHIARFDGSAWTALGSGLEESESGRPFARSVAVAGDDAFIGGNFALAGGSSSLNIALWTGPTTPSIEPTEGDPVRNSIRLILPESSVELR